MKFSSNNKGKLKELGLDIDIVNEKLSKLKEVIYE